MNPTTNERVLTRTGISSENAWKVLNKKEENAPVLLNINVLGQSPLKPLKVKYTTKVKNVIKIIRDTSGVELTDYALFLPGDSENDEVQMEEEYKLWMYDILPVVRTIIYL